MKKLIVVIALFLLCVSSTVFAQNDAQCEAGLTPITHSAGVACVTANPQRVVALEWTYVEDLLALGVQPVGVADIENYNNWVDVPVELDDSVVDVGTRQEPNLELITSLNPDLILAVSFRAAQNYDELSAIAPTLVFNPYPEDGSSQYDEMLTTFSTIASAVNRVEEGEQVLEAIENHFADAQTALETAGHGGETFILSQGWTANDAATFRLFTDNAMAVQILEQIGLENAWDDAPQLYGFTEVSFEGFAGIGDTNFFYVAQPTDDEFFAASPLWNSLPFVSAGHAYSLGGDVWLFGGPLSAELLVDTVLIAMGVELPVAEATPESTLEAAGS